VSRILARAGLALAGCLAGACGYSTGLKVAEQHKTVGLEFFGNDSYERDLERPLDDELSRAIRNMSDAPLVDVGRAEVIVRGEIHHYLRRPGIRSRDNTLLETGVNIEVRATLVERATNQVLRGPVTATSAVGYLIGVPENELDARDRALRHIAEELVLDLFAPVR